jgi:hypothetical protein
VIGGAVAVRGIWDNLHANNGFATGGTRGLWLAPGWLELAPRPAADAFVPEFMRPAGHDLPSPTIELDDSNGDSEISVRGVGGQHEGAPLRMRVQDGQVQVFGPTGTWVDVPAEGAVRFEDGALSWQVVDGELVVTWTDLYGTSSTVGTGGRDEEPIAVQGTADGADQASDMVVATQRPDRPDAEDE